MERDRVQAISKYVTKLHRDMFGRGPKSCKAYLSDRILVVHIVGFMSSVESVLVQGHQSDMAANARQSIVHQMLQEVKGVAQVVLEQNVLGFYHDWSFDNDTGVIVAMLEGTTSANSAMDVEEKRELIDEISRLSQLTEKVPESIDVYQVTKNIVVAIRNGILVPLEQAMIGKGYVDILRTTKASLEKTYFHRDGRFETIFRRKVTDIFLDWDLYHDAGLICFFLRGPESERNA